jgi:hypothetical protein
MCILVVYWKIAFPCAMGTTCLSCAKVHRAWQRSTSRPICPRPQKKLVGLFNRSPIPNPRAPSFFSPSFRPLPPRSRRHPLPPSAASLTHSLSRWRWMVAGVVHGSAWSHDWIPPVGAALSLPSVPSVTYLPLSMTHSSTAVRSSMTAHSPWCMAAVFRAPGCDGFFPHDAAPPLPRPAPPPRSLTGSRAGEGSRFDERPSPSPLHQPCGAADPAGTPPPSLYSLGVGGPHPANQHPRRGGQCIPGAVEARCGGGRLRHGKARRRPQQHVPDAVVVGGRLRCGGDQPATGPALC